MNNQASNEVVPVQTKELSVDEQIKLAELEAKQLELQIKRQQLEAVQLEQVERKYHIQDLRSRISDREIKEKQVQEDRAQQGRTFAQMKATDEYRFKVCTHRKGGVVTPRDTRVLTTGGNKEQFAVIKHQMINGDIWVRCLRCGKTWSPPVEKNFFFDRAGRQVAPQDGDFNRAKFEQAEVDYIQATMFNTNNSMSTSVQCRFSTFDRESGKLIDAADIYRENLSNTTLR